MGQCELFGPKLIAHEMGTRVDLGTIFYMLLRAIRVHEQRQFFQIMGQCEHFTHQPSCRLKATLAHAAVSSGSQLCSP